MNKTLFSILALLCMTLPLTGCGSDDEPVATVTASVTYQINFSQDLLEVADVSIVFVDNNGQVNLDKLSAGSTTWQRNVTATLKDDSPAKFGYKLVYALKGGELTKDSYELRVNGKITATLPNSQRSFDVVMLPEQTVKANKVNQTITNSNNKAYGIDVYKNGDMQENKRFTVSI